MNLLGQPDRCQSNFWLQTLVLKRGRERELEPILAKLHAEKILARPAWNPLHHAPPFIGFPRMNLDTAESLARRIINLPSSPSLAELPR
ncbi:MAG: hypothetical protein EBY76_10565 [Betaproteobacteria bacterium]|nr:hypothetical protein [Betaproteobacteria bacterium]